MTRRWSSTRPLLVLALGAAISAAPMASAKAPVPAPAVAVAGPEAATAGFASRAVVLLQGQALSFANGDLSGHTLTSKLTVKKLVKFGKKTYVTYVPLFDGAVNAGSVGDVKGVANLMPGTYDFYCSLHTGMTGQLTVQAAG
jgi:plastocyanin